MKIDKLIFKFYRRIWVLVEVIEGGLVKENVWIIKWD